MTALAAFVLAMAPQAAGPQNDPAFRLAKTLVGGKWVGKVGKDVPVEFRFHLEDGGNKIVGIGTIAAGSPHPISARSSMGWDPKAHKLYYLDEHGFDTAYFGHVTLENGSLVFDFNGLVNDDGHYRSTVLIEQNRYLSSMDSEQSGTWKPLGFHLELHRTK